MPPQLSRFINHFASIHGLLNHKCDREVGNDYLPILARFDTIRDRGRIDKGHVLVGCE
jgi:hypothetical protein